MPTVVAKYVVEDDFTDSILIIRPAVVPQEAKDFLDARGEVHEEADSGRHGVWEFKVVLAPNGNLYARWDNGDTPERLSIEEPVKVGGAIVRIAGFGREAREDLYIIQEIKADD